MKDTAVVLQARLGSTRLPGKVLMSIGNYTTPDGILNGEIGKYAGVRFIESSNERKSG